MDKTLTNEERLAHLEAVVEGLTTALRAHSHDKDSGVAVIVQRL